MKKIPFSPPDITEEDINAVVNVLKSGWITTGLKTKEFETKISEFCNTKKSVCLNSATAGLFLSLKLFDIKKGDEVITTPFTFAATSNVILQCGAKPIFVDINKNDFNINYDNLEKKINNKTKAIITVDYGGWPVDYNRIKEIIHRKRGEFSPDKNSSQNQLTKPLFISDCAHSFGAKYHNQNVGGFADFSIFSFHAVKNLTTAEGGAISFNGLENITADELYRKFMLLALHGMNKDALDKYKNNNWEYDIETIGYKYNITDIASSFGLTQLARYKDIILRRRELFNLYSSLLSKCDRIIIPHFDTNGNIGSCHLYPIRIIGFEENDRNSLIKQLLDRGISVNVHFKPTPLFTAYKKLGYKIEDYPEAYNKYKNLITLPLYTTLKNEEVDYICKAIIENL